MRHPDSLTSVVVGIDGSSSAVCAALWAVEEAVSRDVPLRLVHVIQSTSVDVRRETAAAEAALRTAHDAVTETDQPVKIDSVVVRGPVAATLAAESVDAVMLCVGSTGAGRRATKFIGATGASAARLARCQVAMIRDYGGTRWSESDDIAVVLEESPHVEAVLHAALEEARLRNATLLALRTAPSQTDEENVRDRFGRTLAHWLGRYPDVQSHTLVMVDDIVPFLAERDPPVQLTVVEAGTGDAARLIGPWGRLGLRDTECSVLLVGP